MVDVVSLIIAVGAVIVAVLSHIKKSSCLGLEIETYEPDHKIIEEKQLLLNPSPELKKSDPIDIPKKEKVFKKENYL